MNIYFHTKGSDRMTILHFWHVLRLYHFSPLIFKCDKLHGVSHVDPLLQSQDKPSLTVRFCSVFSSLSWV